jgi:glycosyltransferase involved in cell wall biosynthesis
VAISLARAELIMKQILFISHDASRTGAPILLLSFLHWFKQNASTPFKILLNNGGLLETEFSKLAPVFVLNRSYPQSLSQRIMSRLGRQSPHPLRQWLAGDNIGLIYSNTITNHQALNALSFLQCPVISHVHELEYVIYLMAGEQLKITKTATTRYITASNAVKENLVNNHHISANQIETVHEFLPIEQLNLTEVFQRQSKIRAELNLPSNAFIVGASGTLGWRKGPDLMIQLAQTMRRHYPDLPVYFLWVGGDEQKERRRLYELQYDVQHLGLEQTVRFLGAKPNSLDFFSIFNVFAMLSREDPYPLVCLEAALLEKPIVCFAKAGGEPEFVEDDCGFVVPYLDIETMAAKIHLLLESTELARAFGKRAAQKVRERHDISTAASQINSIIHQLL